MDGDNIGEILSGITLPSPLRSPQVEVTDVDLLASIARRNLIPVTPIKMKSPYWKHFGVYPKQPDKEMQAIHNCFAACLICWEEYHTDAAILNSSCWEVKYGSWHTTTKLKNHLISHHRPLFMQLLKDNPTTTEEIDLDCEEGSLFTSRSNTSNNKITSFFSNKHVYQEALLKWIVMEFKTIDEVEHDTFRAVLEALCPTVQHVSSKLIKDRLIAKEISVRSKLIKHLQGESIAITIDMWSSVKHEGYMALSAAFINKDWELESWTINCQPFPGKHGAEQTKSKLYELLGEIEINHQNIVCCVTDNDATMNSFADALDFEWQGCLAHLINLVTNFAFNGSFVHFFIPKKLEVIFTN